MELMLAPNPLGVAETVNHSQHDTASGCGCARPPSCSNSFCFSLHCDATVVNQRLNFSSKQRRNFPVLIYIQLFNLAKKW